MAQAAGLVATAWRLPYRVALRCFRALPIPVRQLVVRAATPSYIVGAVCAVVCDGRVLVLRQPHRPGWSLPGGLLGRGESAAGCVQREVLEETGLRVEVGLPVGTVVAPASRRVDVVFRIDVAEQMPVEVGGEAISAAWHDLAGLVDVDEPTRDILGVVRLTTQPQAYRGRVLEHG